jgi:hypothetical protein
VGLSRGAPHEHALRAERYPAHPRARTRSFVQRDSICRPSQRYPAPQRASLFIVFSFFLLLTYLFLFWFYFLVSFSFFIICSWFKEMFSQKKFTIFKNVHAFKKIVQYFWKIVHNFQKMFKMFFKKIMILLKWFQIVVMENFRKLFINLYF